MSPARTTTPASAAAPPGSPHEGDIKLLTWQVAELNKKFDELRVDLRNTYASKVELTEVRQDVAKLESQIGWGVKLILGLVIVAVVGLVMVKTGGGR